MEELFEKINQIPKVEYFDELISRLFAAGRAQEAIELCEVCLRGLNLNENPDVACCFAQKLNHFGHQDRAIELFEKYNNQNLPHHQVWLLETAWAHLKNDNRRVGFDLWQEAVDQDLIQSFVKHNHGAPWISALPKERFLGKNGDISGKRILLVHDGGLGDAIQNVRYVNYLYRDGAAKVFAPLNSPLQRLFCESQFDITDSLINQPADDEWDYIAFPQAILARYESSQKYTTAFPYLHPQEPSEHIQSALQKINHANIKPKVVIFWRSTTPNRAEPYRSIAISKLAPLLSNSDVDFYTAFKAGLTQEEIFYLSHFGVTNLGGHIQDMHDLACIFKEMDLVISIDSAPIHLAGAMNIPVYALISKLTEWRWGQKSNRSFLYPSVTLFRQETLGSWSAPVNQIAGKVKSMRATTHA